MLFVISFKTIGSVFYFISMKSQIRSGIPSALQLCHFCANRPIGHCIFDDNVAPLGCKLNFFWSRINRNAFFVRSQTPLLSVPFVLNFLFLSVMAIEVYEFCRFGNRLIYAVWKYTITHDIASIRRMYIFLFFFLLMDMQSRELSTNAFRSNFLAFDLPTKKALLFIMNYTTQYEVSITAVGVLKFPLSFATLMMVNYSFCDRLFLCIHHNIVRIFHSDRKDVIFVCDSHTFDGLKNAGSMGWVFVLFFLLLKFISQKIDFMSIWVTMDKNKFKLMFIGNFYWSSFNEEKEFPQIHYYWFGRKTFTKPSDSIGNSGMPTCIVYVRCEWSNIFKKV